MSFASTPSQNSLDATRLRETIGKLRAEVDAAESDARRGILLHEVGILEDAVQNDGQAARDLLSAVNSLPEFHEPLERLMVLIERRKSHKNLGKLVDRLVKIAETPEELSRALVAFAEYREDHEGDFVGARQALERAIQARGNEVDAWLALEFLAARTGDDDLRARALAARADLATEPAWRALLFIDAARLRASGGSLEEAITTVQHAVDAKSAATFTALDELGLLGLAADRPDLAAKSLEDQATLIERALAGGIDPEAASVPEIRRSSAHVADLWLRAARLHRSRGDVERALGLLDRVVERLPDDPVATAARMRVAEFLGDTATVERLALGELGHGVKGGVAAALWIRVAEAAATRGEGPEALTSLSKALGEDPGSIPAQALKLDISSSSGDGVALATALESAAGQLGSDTVAAELFVLAADTWARVAGDTGAARAALSLAGGAGASPEMLARVGRTLASLARDGAWFDESTRRLLATNPPEAERAGLWFELGRARLLKGDVAGAADAFASLGTVPGGAWLGTVLRAYAVPPAKSGESAPAIRPGAALSELSSLAEDSSSARAFRAAAAFRFQLSGQLDRAIAELEELCTSEPSDVVAAVALATLHRRKDEPAKAAVVLARCAGEASDDAVAASLYLEAGIVNWLAGDRAGALERFEAAASRSPEAAAGLFSWALRAALPNDVGSRRKALDAAEPGEVREAMYIERFALEAGAEGDLRTLAAAPVVTDDGALGVALELTQALSPTVDAEAREHALASLASRSDAALAIARASAHFGKMSDPAATKAETLRTAERWAASDRSVASALEWFTRTIASEDVDREIAARKELGERLGGTLGESFRTSARLLLRLVHDDVDSPPLAGSDAETVLANLELAPPSCDPRRRAAALLDGANFLDDASTAPAIALAGWNLLAAGDTAGAIRAFRSYLDEHREDIVGWEGLRAAAELAADKPLLAEASAALGDLSSDPGQGAELWERAATILLDQLRDPVRGEEALSRAVARDITRFQAFDRLFRMVRARRDGPRLLELVSQRLAVAEDPDEIAKLYWERARVLRESGDAQAALEALDNVTMLEPDHVGALALSGEIYITEKRFEDAAEKLARLAALMAAPSQQRLMSGIAAVDLYENRLGKVDRALEVLVALHRGGLATLPVRERLARVAAKRESWDTATEILEELMGQRETREGRIEAARLAMAVYRDRIGEPRRAARAVERLLQESADDGEALDLVLSGHFPRQIAGRLLQQGRAATLDALAASPLDLERMARLAEIARELEDVQLRQVTLGAVVALGDAKRNILGELDALDSRVAKTPQIAIDDRVIQSLRDPDDRGPIADLMAALATSFNEVLGPGLATFGVGKKERIRPQDGLPLRNEISAWVGALGLGEFELYVGGRDNDGIFGVPSETPAIIVGDRVAQPLSTAHRQALARELLSLKLGTTILRHRDATDVAALIAAACNVSGARVDSPPYAMLAEFERQLSKDLSRRAKKLLPELAENVAQEGRDPLEWVRAAKSSLDRIATIAVGDVSFVLASGEGTARGEAPSTTEAKLRASRLLSFVLSPTFFAVREKLGMGVR